MKPAAKAIPPPNNNKIPHGNFTASSQFNSRLFLFFVGIKKIITALIIAIIVSSIAGTISFRTKSLVTHAVAVKANIIATNFSS